VCVMGPWTSPFHAKRDVIRIAPNEESGLGALVEAGRYP